MNRIRKKFTIYIGKYLITVRYAGITIAMILILSTFAFPSFSVPVEEQQILSAAYAKAESGCIVYNHKTLMITI